MAKVKYSGGADIVRWFKQKMDNVQDGTSNAISDSVSLGEERAKEYVLTRGTLKSGKQGRVETGRMVSAITSSFNQTGKGNAVGRFGWLRDRADYFKYQEGGFQHSPGVEVEGMYAISDANKDVEEFLRDAVRDVMRNA